MRRYLSIGMTIFLFILITGVAVVTGQWRGTDSPILIGILAMLWCIAILLGEIIIRIERTGKKGEE